jgi:RNase H-like domain found in reverse transcriptase
VLAHFIASADTFGTADASGRAVEACKLQRMNGVERPVAFASRVLSPAKRKYS